MLKETNIPEKARACLVILFKVSLLATLATALYIDAIATVVVLVLVWIIVASLIEEYDQNRAWKQQLDREKRRNDKEQS